MRSYEQILAVDINGDWHVRIVIENIVMRTFEFGHNENKARAFYRLVSDIVYYIKS